MLCKNTGRFNVSTHEDQVNENIVNVTRDANRKIKKDPFVRKLN